MNSYRVRSLLFWGKRNWGMSPIFCQFSPYNKHDMGDIDKRRKNPCQSLSPGIQENTITKFDRMTGDIQDP